MFGTGLSSGEAAMARAAELQPLGQATGACVYRTTHIRGHGQTTRYPPGEIYRFYEPVEGVVLSRRKALRRLSAAARELGADLVTGVRIDHAEREIPGARETEGGIVEATATGYALSRSGKPRVRRKPVLATVSVGEYWKLTQSGYAPADVVMATVMVGCTAASAGPSGGVARDPAREQRTDTRDPNRELTDVSTMVRAAWKLAEKIIRQQAQADGAEGVVGVTFSSRKWLADAALEQLTVKMVLTVTGTSIAPARDVGTGTAAERGPLVITPVRHVS